MLVYAPKGFGKIPSEPDIQKIAAQLTRRGKITDAKSFRLAMKRQPWLKALAALVPEEGSSTPSACVAESQGWISASNSPSRESEPSPMSNAKLTPAQPSSPGSEKEPSTTPQYFPTSSSSTHHPSVAMWLSCTARHPAKVPAPPANEKATAMIAGSGVKRSESSASASPPPSTSRTSPASSAVAYWMISAGEPPDRWKKWVSALRATCGLRRKSATPTSASGSSSSASDAGRSHSSNPGAGSSQWQTPNLPNGGGKTRGGGRGDELLLEGQAPAVADELWMTPDASRFSPTLQTGRDGFASDTHLVTQAEALWRTPATTDVGTPLEKNHTKEGDTPELGHRMYRTGPDGQEINQTQSLELQANLAAELWGTPRASDGEKGGPNMAFGAGGTPLPTQAASECWQTPTVQDANGRTYSYDQGDHDKVTVTLAGQAEGLPSQPEEMWPTPNAEQGTGYMSGSNRDTWRPTLEGRAEGYVPTLHEAKPDGPTPQLWTTPHGMSSTDATGKAVAGGEFAEKVVRTMEAICPSPHPGPETSTPGGESSPSAQISPRPSAEKRRRLNAAFVGWLQGLPEGWLTESISCAPQETALSPCSRQFPYCSCYLCSTRRKFLEWESKTLRQLAILVENQRRAELVPEPEKPKKQPRKKKGAKVDQGYVWKRDEETGADRLGREMLDLARRPVEGESSEQYWQRMQDIDKMTPQERSEGRRWPTPMVSDDGDKVTPRTGKGSSLLAASEKFDPPPPDRATT